MLDAPLMQPIAIYLSELLDPIVKRSTSVLYVQHRATKTPTEMLGLAAQLLSRDRHCRCEAPSSIELSDLMCTVSPRIRAFHSDRDLVESLLINVRSAIIKSGTHII